MKSCAIGALFVVIVACSMLHQGCDGYSNQASQQAKGPQDGRALEDPDAEYERQLSRTSEQLRIVEEQGKRYDALLEKWEQQARRIDAILDRWDAVVAALEQRARELAPPQARAV